MYVSSRSSKFVVEFFLTAMKQRGRLSYNFFLFSALPAFCILLCNIWPFLKCSTYELSILIYNPLIFLDILLPFSVLWSDPVDEYSFIFPSCKWDNCSLVQVNPHCHVITAYVLNISLNSVTDTLCLHLRGQAPSHDFILSSSTASLISGERILLTFL